ncbi:UNVERIFIED_CONTAM: hypothetical protein RMT77_006618 [Armadillidium vulgare]
MKFSKVNWTLLPFTIFYFILLQHHFQIAHGYGQFCFQKLEACKENEICNLSSKNNNTGICECLEGYIEIPQNKSCVQKPPDIPHGNESHSSGAALGVGITFLFIAVILIAGFLHYKYRIFNGIAHSFYRFRRRPSGGGGQAYQIADDGDDIHPIV